MGITLVSVVTIYIIVITILPSKVFVQRSINVDTTPAEIYNYLEDLRNFQEWSYWAEIDPKTSYKYTGPMTGTGSRMDWKSDNPSMAYGNWWIVSTTPYDQIKCNILLKDFDKPAIRI